MKTPEQLLDEIMDGAILCPGNHGIEISTYHSDYSKLLDCLEADVHLWADQARNKASDLPVSPRTSIECVLINNFIKEKGLYLAETTAELDAMVTSNIVELCNLLNRMSGRKEASFSWQHGEIP